MNKFKALSRLGYRLGVASVFAALAATAAVVPPQAHPYGKTYAEWSAAHWQWTYSLPADQHPLTDTADVSAGQSGPVWFLGGTFAPTVDLNGHYVGVAERHVRIPQGKALFFPILDSEASTAEGNGSTEAELRAFASYLTDHSLNLTCTIDGQPVTNLEAYRVVSPLFAFGPLPTNNLLGLSAGTVSPSVSDGYFVMLTPLSVGQHTIHFGGATIFTQVQDGFDFQFSLDITYHLTVK